MDALVFSGGGARGAYQIGVYEGLRETGLEPDLVTGTSVGAILATLVASGCTFEQMKRLWREACRASLFPYRKDVWRVHTWSHVRENEALGLLAATPLQPAIEAGQRLDANVLDLDPEQARGEDTQAYFEGRHADQERLERFGPEEAMQAGDDEGAGMEG